MAMAEADWLPIVFAVGPGAGLPDSPAAEKSPPKSAARTALALGSWELLLIFMESSKATTSTTVATSVVVMSDEAKHGAIAKDAAAADAKRTMLQISGPFLPDDFRFRSARFLRANRVVVVVFGLCNIRTTGDHRLRNGGHCKKISITFLDLPPVS